MQKHNTLFFLLLCGPWLLAQQASVLRSADFSTTNQTGSTVLFKAEMPPLQQKAGAPTAYYSYYWEFGDGSFAFTNQPEVAHTYPREGEYNADLSATNHYDDGKKPVKKRRNLRPNPPKQALAAADMPDVFDPQKKQAIALKASSQPKAGEEITCVLSYRNLGNIATDGRLHLFFNEKNFPSTHFKLVEARPYFGEKSDATYGTLSSLSMDWLAFSPIEQQFFTTKKTASWGASAQNILPPGEGHAPPYVAEELLRQAEEKYRAHDVWRFGGLRAGEKRNFFVTFGCLPTMLKDTSALIHLGAMFQPTDPMLPPEWFELEIEIVSSHDPNAIAVSDHRVSFRKVSARKLDYKIRFQNNGEGPASTIKVTVKVPDGLSLAKMKPLDWSPACPICPDPPGERSCMDTSVTEEGLVFTFRNIYLPGSRQEGVEKYDSTQGYVRYRIVPERNMPKRSFSSQAEIIFDKNAPVVTNRTKTRFKPGLSPGIKGGYGFEPENWQKGYYFLGLTLAPYKSYRIFPQVELLTGIRNQTNSEPVAYKDSIVLLANADQIVFRLRDSLVSSSRGFLSFELPVSLRKNVNRFLGFGLGGAARVSLLNGTDRYTVESSTYRSIKGQVTTKIAMMAPVTKERPYSGTQIRYSVFGDVLLGSVRAGLNIGLRGGAFFTDAGPKPFGQVSAELKW